MTEIPPVRSRSVREYHQVLTRNSTPDINDRNPGSASFASGSTSIPYTSDTLVLLVPQVSYHDNNEAQPKIIPLTIKVHNSWINSLTGISLNTQF